MNSGIRLKVKLEISEVNGSSTFAKNYKFVFPEQSNYAARRIVIRRLMDFLLARELYTVSECFVDVLTFDMKRIGKSDEFEILAEGESVKFSKKGGQSVGTNPGASGTN